MSPATTLAGAFQDDPLFSWVQPDPERRRTGLLPVFRAVVRRCAALGRVVDKHPDVTAAGRSSASRATPASA